MKKIIYILTSLILLLPNISFGQIETFCTQPIITTTQTSYPIGSNLTLGIFRIATGATTDSENLLYYNFIYPNGDTTSLTSWELDEEAVLLVKENLTLADSGWYYVRFRQSGCSTRLDSIRISVLDTNIGSSCSKPVIGTNVGRYEELQHVELPIIRQSSTGTYTSDTLFINVWKNNYGERTTRKIWSNNNSIENFDFINYTLGNTYIEYVDTVRFLRFRKGGSIFHTKRGVSERDTGWVHIEFEQKGCPITTDSIYISIKDTNAYLKNLKYYIPQKEFLDYRIWSFNGDGDSTNWLNGKKFRKILDDSTLSYFGKQYAEITPYRNFLAHYTQNQSDTAFSPIYYNKGYTNTKLTFDVSHCLTLDNGVSSYDTLIINAFYSGSQIPNLIYKKGGQDLKTTYPSNSLFNPFIPRDTNLVSLVLNWRNDTVNLTQCDTAKSVRFQVILKEPIIAPGDTKPSNAIYIKDFGVIGKMSVDSIKTPTLSVDNSIDDDTITTLTISFPNNHKAKLFDIFYDSETPDYKNTKELYGTVIIKDNKFDFINKVRAVELSEPVINETFRRENHYEKYFNGEISQETYKDTVKGREDYNDTTFTFALSRFTEGTYKFYCLVKSTGAVKYSDTVIFVSNYREPDLVVGKLSADSTFNRDKNYKLYLDLPTNHEAKEYRILIGSNQRFSGFINNNNRDTTIVFQLNNMSDGEYVHRARLINLEKETITETNSEPLNVTVNTKIIASPPILSLNNSTTNIYDLSISIPANSSITEYGLIENNLTIQSFKVTNNNSRIDKTISITNKPNGRYTYFAYVKYGSLIIRSSPIVVTVPIPVQGCESEILTASNTTRNNFTYSFKLNQNCSNTGYKALFYVGNNANGLLANNNKLTIGQVKTLSWSPSIGTPRNGVAPNNNIQLTLAEIRTGFFNRRVDTPLNFSNRWYRVDIICTTCTQANKTKTAYFYVTN